MIHDIGDIDREMGPITEEAALMFKNFIANLNDHSPRQVALPDGSEWRVKWDEAKKDWRCWRIK